MEVEVVKCADQLPGTSRDVPISRCIDVCGPRHSVARPPHDGTIHHDLTGADHGLGMSSRSGQPAPDHFKIKALGHRSGRLSVVRLILIRPIQGVLQCSVNVSEPIVMLLEWR